jgi:vanillate O-demethylase ferredoxin subunit
MKVLVRSLTVEADEILSIELVACNGDTLPEFTAGAHIDLHLTPGLSRSYSLVNPQQDRERYVVAVNKDPSSRGGSRHVHEALRPGQVIEISEPRNNFALVEDAPHVVLVAGGIGVTPLWCMVQRLESLGRSWELHYSARNRRKCAYLRQVESLGQAHPGRVHLRFDDENGGVPMDLAALIRTIPVDAHVYCCGPVPMLKAFEQATAARDPQTVHVEYFSAKSAAAVGGGYQVVLARSGVSFAIAPGRTILEVLLEGGIDVPHSCTQGVCGACETRVIEGTPDHRDAVLSPQEIAAGKTMMICCSGAKTPTLVLEL